MKALLAGIGEERRIGRQPERDRGTQRKPLGAVAQHQINVFEKTSSLTAAHEGRQRKGDVGTLKSSLDFSEV